MAVGQGLGCEGGVPCIPGLVGAVWCLYWARGKPWKIKLSSFFAGSKELSFRQIWWLGFSCAAGQKSLLSSRGWTTTTPHTTQLPICALLFCATFWRYNARQANWGHLGRVSGVSKPSVTCWVCSQALIRRRSTEPNLKHCKRNEKQSWDLLLNWCLKNSNWLIDWNWKLHTKCNWKCCNCGNWWNLLCQWKQDITNTHKQSGRELITIVRTVCYQCFILVDNKHPE